MNIHRHALLLLARTTIAICIVCAGTTAGNQNGEQKTTAADEKGQRTKIAEGEYAISQEANSGAVGPFGEELYNFHETWMLFRNANGSYQVEGERNFESPEGTPRSSRFLAELSRDLTITRVTEFAPLRWRRDSGPLTCEFLRNELHCSSNAKDAQQAVELRIPMQRPFGLLWPISAFSLSGLTREAERDPKRAAQIQLVTIDQPSAEMPVNPTVLDGELRYLGEERIDVAGQPQRAFKFSIKAAMTPELTVWTTPKGLLLAVVVDRQKDWPREEMKLLSFRQWAGF